MAERVGCLVLGAGMAGLGAMHALAAEGVDFLCLEAADLPGGLAATDVVGGFSFDRAGHFLHVRDARFREAIEASGVALAAHERRAAVVIDGHAIPYPVQYNLHAAPAGLRQAALAHIAGEGRAPLLHERRASLEEALLDQWGPALFDSFFRPFNEKLWRRPLSRLPADCVGRFLSAVDPSLVRQGAEGPIPGFGYNARFLYPQSGRIGDLPKGLARPFSSRIGYGAAAVELDLAARTCFTGSGRIRFERMVSTAPLPALLAMAGRDIPTGLDLASSDVAVLRLGVRGHSEPAYHWVYVPDPALPFHRINFTGPVGARGPREDSHSILVEYGLAPGARGLAEPERAALQALEWLRANGILADCALELWDETLIRPAYVVHRQEGRSAFQSLEEELRGFGLYLAGRYGRWDYYSMEDSFLSGADAARRAML